MSRTVAAIRFNMDDIVTLNPKDVKVIEGRPSLPFPRSAVFSGPAHRLLAHWCSAGLRMTDRQGDPSGIEHISLHRRCL